MCEGQSVLESSGVGVGWVYKKARLVVSFLQKGHGQGESKREIANLKH